MESSNRIALICLVIALPQGAVACHQIHAIWERRRRELKDGIVIRDSTNPLVVLLLLACTVAAVWLSAWMFYDKPLRPVTIEKPVIVQKAIPCDSQITGNASANNGSTAQTGNDDSANTPAKPAKPKPK